MQAVSVVEYIWLDGSQPTQSLRSKARVVPYSDNIQAEQLPEWSFDGSSTNQATGDKSDCLLTPVYICQDPIRGDGNYLALCEVLNPDRSIHQTNKRALLRQVMESHGIRHDPYIGFEQEYTLFKNSWPLGWPSDGYPAPQGPYYCSVGAGKAFGRPLIEEHTADCIKIGLNLYGINAEVMPGQWEFQIGYRGFKNEAADPLSMSDQLWIARYLLQVLAEKYDIVAKFDCKPMQGDWNGAGMHTNFSTKSMRSPETGKQAIEHAVKALSYSHEDHIKVYGDGLADRLTGKHETCSIHDFRSGVSDRGASIRIPVSTAEKGYGYIEDRRPGANADPYAVSLQMIKTICC